MSEYEDIECEPSESDDGGVPPMTEDEREFVKILEEVDYVQGELEKLARMGTPEMACQECGGRGSVGAGILGEYECVTCQGRRTVAMPFAGPPRQVIALLDEVRGHRSQLVDEKGNQLAAIENARLIGEKVRDLEVRAVGIARQLASPAAAAELGAGDEPAGDDVDEADLVDEGDLGSLG